MEGTGKRAFSTESITYIALLIALQVILGNLLQIPLLEKQFSFGFLPIAIAGALFGLPAAMIVGGLGDFFGAHLFPAGVYFYGFTITNIIVGALYAIPLYGRKPGLVRALIASALVAACYLFLNSYWLSVLYSSKTYWLWVGTRAVSYLFEIPICTAIIFYTLKGLNKLRLPGVSALSARRKHERAQ